MDCIGGIRATGLLRSKAVVGRTQGVALLLTYVGGGLLRPYFACALSSAALFSIIWGDVHPQVLLRPVSLPVDNDEIACHHSVGGHDMILFKK